MSSTAAENHVPLSTIDIRRDIERHSRAGWNFVGATTEGVHEEVILHYRKSRGDSTISSDAVADAVADHLRYDEHLVLRIPGDDQTGGSLDTRAHCDDTRKLAI